MDDLKVILLVLITILLIFLNYLVVELIDECKLGVVKEYVIDVEVKPGATLHIHDKISFPEETEDG